MSKKHEIDLPVCLLTIASLEVVRLIDVRFAWGLALGLMVGCIGVLWVAGKNKAGNPSPHAVGISGTEMDHNPAILNPGTET